MRGELTKARLVELVAWLALVVVTAVFFPGCPRPQPGEPPPTPAKCSGKLISDCGPLVLPLVNECLVGQGDVVTCILGITKLVGCATYDVIACVVKDQGDKAAAAYQANHEDSRDHWRAQRAEEFLSRTHASFAP